MIDVRGFTSAQSVVNDKEERLFVFRRGLLNKFIKHLCLISLNGKERGGESVRLFAAMT